MNKPQGIDMADEMTAQDVETATRQWTAHFERKERECGIPEHCIGGLSRWIVHGISPGGFLRYVLENNLVDAYGKADHINAGAMRNYAQFLVTACPIGSWRHLDAISNWHKTGGMRGQALAKLNETNDA